MLVDFCHTLVTLTAKLNRKGMRTWRRLSASAQLRPTLCLSGPYNLIQLRCSPFRTEPCVGSRVEVIDAIYHMDPTLLDAH